MVQTTPASPSLGGQRGHGEGQLLQELEALSQALYQAGHRKDEGEVVLPAQKVLARRESMPARPVSEPIALGALLRSPHPRPPVPGKGATPSPTSSSASADAGKNKPESSRMEVGKGGSESPGRLQQWHSQGFEKNMPEVSNFSEWVEDSVDFSQKLEAPAEKKKGLWGWRPFRAIAHMGQQKYNCLFTVHVHGIEGLPMSMNGLRLSVHFARKDDTGVQTMPSRVFQGYAEFQETLNLRCSLFGSKNNAKGIKWESKQFVLSVVAMDADELVLGRHKLELTRLLPEYIEDDEEKQDTWTTSFKLTGKAQGATLIVTFGCEIQSRDSQSISATSSSRFGESPVLRAVRSFSSSPNSGHATHRSNPDAQFSPAMSESSADYPRMEHLSLDDAHHESPFSPVKGNTISSDSQAYPVEDVKGRVFTQTESVFAPPTPGQSAEGPSEATKNHRYVDRNESVNVDEEEEEEEEDYEMEFTVVEQGHELGVISDTMSSHGYTDLEAEDQSVQEEELAAESFDGSNLPPRLQEEEEVGEEEEEEDDYAPALSENLGVAEDVLDNEVSKEVITMHMEYEEDALGSGEEEEEEELEKCVIDYNEVSQSETCNDYYRVENVSRMDAAQNSALTQDQSMDEELEMQELLAALGEEEQDSDGEDPVDSLYDYGNTQSQDLQAETLGYSHPHTDPETEKHVLDLPDDMTEEELLSLLPGDGQSNWNSDKEVIQSKVPESDDEFDPVAGEFLSLLETPTGPAPVGLTSDSEPDSPRALLLKQFENEALLESGLGLDMKLPEASHYIERSEVPELYLDGMSGDSGCNVGTMEESYKLGTHEQTSSEDFNNLGWGSEEDVELASIMEAAESELQKATQTMRSRNRAKMLEDEETEALMQEWGLNKKVFEASPPRSSAVDDTGNPYAMVMADLPSLGKSLGPVVQTGDGGTLRSMSPGNFQAANGGKLVMQVSKPVVVPVDMGASSMDILRRMATAGMEGMADQAMMAMPLDDITGKSVEQIASEGFAALEGSQGRGHYGFPALEGGRAVPSLEYGQESQRSHGALASRGGSGLATTSRGHSSRRNSNPNLDDTFMSLEDLAPMAMQKIEALALEGLKIQSDMAEEEAPYMVDPLSWQDMAALEGGSASRRRGGKSGGISSLEGVTAMRLLDGGSAETSGSEDDGLGMAISLDEWMRLDAGVYDENETNDNTMALLATHQANHGEIVPGKQKNNEWSKGGADATNVKGGLMGDTLTLAMLVQLRDPLRNYEPVGAPMMALVQAERVMVPPTPKVRLGRRISLKGNSEDSDEESNAPTQPQFKITEVTISGMQNSEASANEKQKPTGWGNQKQLQSGSRWLVASGMGKATKHPVLQSRSKAGPLVPAASKPASTTVKADSMWSISSKTGSKWGAPAAAKTRNPDVAMAKVGWFGRKK